MKKLGVVCPDGRGRHQSAVADWRVGLSAVTYPFSSGRLGGAASRLFNMRVELQLEVSGSANQRCALVSQSLKRFDARRVDGHQVRQIELKGRTSAQAPSSSGTCATLNRPASRTRRRSVS